MQWQCKGIYCWLVPLAVLEVEAASISLYYTLSLSSLLSALSAAAAVLAAAHAASLQYVARGQS